MIMLHLASAELTEKLKTARGAKRRKILAELQRRYDETVPLPVINAHVGARAPRYDFALYHA